MTNTWYAINRKSDTPTEAEISIYDAIGAYGISAENFVRDLKAIKAKTINVRLNTPGGEVFDGTAIYNAIREHPARVVMHVDGVAASAGSFIATAGDEVRMAENAYLMMHNAMGGIMGGADEMRSAASMLEKVNSNIAGMYQRKAGRDAAYWRNLMDAETWFTAEEAKAAGLVDTVYAATKADATTTTNSRPHFDFKIYNKIPEPVRQRWGLIAPPSASFDPAPALQFNNPAPEATVVSVPPSGPTSKEHLMPTAPDSPAVTAPPAQQPAAATAPPLTVTIPHQVESHPTVSSAMANFQAIQGQQLYDAGKRDGIKEGIAQTQERARAIAGICGEDTKLAVFAILGTQDPEAVKLAFDAKTAEAEKAKAENERKDVEILRLTTLLALGGHPGIAMAPPVDYVPEHIADPKAHAEKEWDLKPSVRKGFSSKDRYVAIRVAELSGQLQTYQENRQSTPAA